MGSLTEREQDAVADVIAVGATRVAMFRLDFTLPGWEDYVLFAVPREAAVADTLFSDVAIRAPKATRAAGRHKTKSALSYPLAIDRAARTLLRNGIPVSLPPRCYDLLLTLVERKGRVVSRDELVEAVWGDDATVGDRSVDTAIWHLRRAIEVDPQSPVYILTVAKHGYRLGARVRTR